MMAHSLVLINRALYSTLVVTCVGMVVLQLGLDAPAPADITAMAIAPPAPAPFAEPAEFRLPQHNIFDPDGLAWQAALARPAAPAHQEAVEKVPVRGIIRLEELEGVMTPKGFVAVGEKLGADTLTTVGDGRYAVQTPSGQTLTFFVDPGRQQRRAQVLEHLRRVD